MKGRLFPKTYESGQSIILMAFLMIGLLGALGLAIDGGRLFMARRDTQNAVDAAILMASYALCNGKDPVPAGLDAAAANGLAHDGENVLVTIANPPLSPPLDGSGALIEIDPRYFVEVYITQRLEPFFIQFVYGGDLMVTSHGIGSCTPPFDPRGVPAVWAGSLTCETCDANPSGNSVLTWTGSQSEFYSTGNLFFSNGNIFLNGSEAQPSIVEGGIESHCDVRFSGTQLGDYPVDTGVPPMVEPPIPYRINDFAPGGYLALRAQTDPQYGIYYAITPVTVTLQYWQSRGYAQIPEPYSWYNSGKNEWVPDGVLEGLYYVEFPVSLGPSKARLDDTPADDNTEWNGITIASTQEIKMVNPIGELRYYIGGILFFSDFRPGEIACNMSETGIEVSGYSSVIGCIIAPWSGIQFSANSTSVVGAIIGQFVWMRGADMYFEYNPTMLDPRPPTVQMIN